MYFEVKHGIFFEPYNQLLAFSIHASVTYIELAACRASVNWTGMQGRGCDLNFCGTMLRDFKICALHIQVQ